MDDDEKDALVARIEELTGRVETLEGRVGNGMNGKRRVGQEIDVLRRIAACAKAVFDGNDIFPGNSAAGHQRARRLAAALTAWDGEARSWKEQ